MCGIDAGRTTYRLSQQLPLKTQDSVLTNTMKELLAAYEAVRVSRCCVQGVPFT